MHRAMNVADNDRKAKRAGRRCQWGLCRRGVDDHVQGYALCEEHAEEAEEVDDVTTCQEIMEALGDTDVL